MLNQRQAAIISIILSTVINTIWCQRGLLYGTALRKLHKVTPIKFLQSSNEYTRKNVAVNLDVPMFFYGKSFYGDGKIYNLRVYQDGVVSVGVRSLVEICPRSPIDADGDIIAPYWMQFTSGRVSIQQVKGINGLKSKEESKRMKNEINQAFVGDLKSEDDVRGILIITWENMKNKQNEKRKELKNSFQLAIVTTKSASYAIFVYRVLDISYVNPLNGKTPNCTATKDKNSVIAVGASSFEGDFDLTQFFRAEVRDWVAYFSNINDYQNLGRYIIKMQRGVKQPLPPIAECRKENKDPIICIRTSWFSVQQKVSEDFCTFRDAGSFAYPFTCNQYVTCGVGKKSFRLSVCPNGTNFNPALGICDFKENYECAFPKQAMINTNTNHEEKKKKLNMTSTIFEIHSNFCFLRGNGLYADLDSCPHYFHCDNGRTLRLKCGNKLMFQETGEGLGNCNYPAYAACFKKPPPPTPFCVKHGYGFFANPRNCRKFITCIRHGRGDWIERHFKCPTNYLFLPQPNGRGYCYFQHKVCCRHGKGAIAC